MLVSVYYKLSLFNAHAMILIFMNVNKLCLNQETKDPNQKMKTEKQKTKMKR